MPPVTVRRPLAFAGAAALAVGATAPLATAEGSTAASVAVAVLTVPGLLVPVSVALLVGALAAGPFGPASRTVTLVAGVLAGLAVGLDVTTAAVQTAPLATGLGAALLVAAGASAADGDRVRWHPVGWRS